MKTFICFAAILALTVAAPAAKKSKRSVELEEAGDQLAETEFGPFENETHRCNFDCSKAIDLAIVLDASGSINDDDPGNFHKVITFAVDIIDNFPVGRWQTRVSVVIYSSKVEVKWLLNANKSAEDMKQDLLDHEREYYMGGWTNTHDALDVLDKVVFTERNGDREGVNNVAVFLTDGGSSHLENPDNYKDPLPVASAVFRRGITVVGVGVGRNVNEKELKQISSKPQQKDKSYFTTMNFQDLHGIVGTLLLRTCRAICIPKEYVCNEALDLAFIIDASGSIQKEDEARQMLPNPDVIVNTNWFKIMQFVKNIIARFQREDHDHRFTRFAITTFSNQGIVRANFNYSGNPQDYNQLLDNYNLFGDGKTNTYAGLYETCNNVFNGPGDRLDVPDVAIIITDGKSSHTSRKYGRQFRDPVPVAQKCIQDGVNLIGVGVTKNADHDELKEITSDPWKDGYQTRFAATDFDALEDILEDFLRQLMGQYCYRE